MTAHQIVKKALRKLNIRIEEIDVDDVQEALEDLNLLLSNFSYWIEADLPNISLTEDEESPFPDYYNEAFITKLAIKQAGPFQSDAMTVQKLLAEDAYNMHRLDYKEALGKSTKASTTVI